MKLSVIFFIVAMVVLGHQEAKAQRGFFMINEARTIDIPFECTSNFILLNFTINNRFPLRFVFDTGAGHTILTKKEIGSLLNLHYERTFQVLGSDLSQPINAYLAKGIRLEMPQKIVAPMEDILVLEDDFFKFEEYTGINVQGILSANSFSRYIVKINYDRNIITLYHRNYFKESDLKGFTSFPIEMNNDKPYFKTTLKMAADSVVAVKLLMDTGATMPMLLFANTHPMLHPPANAIPSNIGIGLGGDLEGFIGRVKDLPIGPFHQQNVVTYFQVLDTIMDTVAIHYRNGLIGNGILNRFTVVFDYYGERVWLKPSKRYTEAFVYDRSGLSIISTGITINVFIVLNVIPNSPAAEADIRKGDKIIKIAGKPVVLTSLSSILKKLQGSAGKKVKITIERNGKRIKKEVILRDLL